MDGYDAGCEAITQQDPGVEGQLSARADEGFPAGAAGGEPACKQDLDFAGQAGALAVEAGGDDFGVVEHQAIGGAEVGGEIGEVPVLPLATGAMEDEQAGGGALGEGMFGDEFRGRS